MIRCMLFALVLGIAVGAPAAEDGVFPQIRLASPDPLRLGSLPFDAMTAIVPDPGVWDVTVSVGWFNVWNADGRAASVRREFGLPRNEQITDEELRQLELRYPDDDLVYADFEGILVQTEATVGLTENLGITVMVPWMSIGSPNWDAIPEGWHDLVGITQSNRTWFPRGGSLLYIEGQGTTLTRRDLDEAGIGDVSVTVTATVGSWMGADHVLEGIVDLPTGEVDTLRGSGGFDLGIRWFGRWRWRKSRLVVGAGLSRLDRNGSFLGIERDDTWQVGAHYDRRLGSRVVGSASVTYQSSPLSGFTASDAGNATLIRTLGVSVRVADTTWLSLRYGMDWAGAGLFPDVSLRAAASVRF